MRAILTYHSIDPSGSVISVDQDAFRRHLRWLATGGVQVTTLADLAALPPEADGVALTFDDGFANFSSLAWPLLRDHGLPATVFIVTERAGATNAWDDAPRDATIPTLPLMDWDTAARVAAEGAELGSHTRRHPRLSRLDPARIEDEVAGSARALEAHTGVRPRGFAYPYGDVGPAALAAVRRSYAWACTTELNLVGPDSSFHLLPRLDMYYFRAPGRLEAWGTARFRRYLWLRSRARRLRQRLAAVTARQ